MSLPLQAIDRLFDRLAATYGRQWFLMWEGVDAGAVKTLWAHELSGYTTNLRAIAWALENLPERCPNVVEFRNLCRHAPAAETQRLPEPKADPARVAEELAKLAPLRKAIAASSFDGLAWARAIMTKHRGGLRVNVCPLKMAREALAKSGALE